MMGEVPRFCRVTTLGGEVAPTTVPAKISLVSDSASSVPWPVKLTVWGLLGSLSVMTRVPLLVPAALGVNVTLMRQFSKAATLDPHALAALKLPVVVIELIVIGCVVEGLVNSTA